MNPQDPNPASDDSALQDALRTIAGRHSASEGLRARVAAAMANVGDTTLPLSARREPSAITRLLRMAAAIAVTVGVAGTGYWWYMESGIGRRSGGAGGEYDYSTGLWTAMAELHRDPDEAATTQPVAPLTSPADLAAAAGQRLGWRVPVPQFSDASLTLDSATYCTIAGHPAVRFHFGGKTDGDSVTLVSLAETAWTYRSADHYARVINDQPIAGYVKDGGLHCVIGGRDASPDRIQALVDQLRAQ